MHWMRPLSTFDYTRSKEKTYEEVSKEYRVWYYAVPFFQMIFWISMTILSGMGLYLLYQLRLFFVSESVYLIPLPWWELFLLPTILPPFILSRWTVAHFYLRVLGEYRFAEYLDYCSVKEGNYDPYASDKRFFSDHPSHNRKEEELIRFSERYPRLYKRWVESSDTYSQLYDWWTPRLFVAPTLLIHFILFILLCNSYVRVTETSVIVNHLWRLTEKEYLYKDIRMINTSTSGSHYFIYFITQSEDFRFEVLDLNKEQEIVEYISEASGREIVVDDPYGL